MIGRKSSPTPLEIDWLVGPFAQSRPRAQPGYTALVRERIGQASVSEGVVSSPKSLFAGRSSGGYFTAQPCQAVTEPAKGKGLALPERLGRDVLLIIIDFAQGET